MSNIDVMQLAKYGIGALLIIAGVALIYIGKPTEGMVVVGLGMGLLGYQFGYTSGIKAVSKHP
jgi:hypothetical protein